MVALRSNPEPMEDYSDPHDFDEAEDALSLCDLPLYSDATNWEDSSKEYHRPSSSDQEFFEFSSDLSGEFFPSNDIIFCGKLIPFKESLSHEIHMPANNENRTQSSTKKSFFRRRSSSLKQSQSMRNSRSSDKQLEKFSCSKTSVAPGKYRNSSNKCSGNCDLTARKEPILSSSAKPRWYLIMFGMVKFPAEMELKDIRNRQTRRNSSSLFPAFDAGKPVNSLRSGGKSSFWRLLRALGCKGHANAMAKASLGCVPHV